MFLANALTNQNSPTLDLVGEPLITDEEVSNQANASPNDPGPLYESVNDGASAIPCLQSPPPIPHRAAELHNSLSAGTSRVTKYRLQVFNTN